MINVRTLALPPPRRVRLHPHRGARRRLRADGRRPRTLRAASTAANGATNRIRSVGGRDQPRPRADRGRAQRPLREGLEPERRAELQALPGLEDIDGGAYTIRRSGTTTASRVDVCIDGRPEGRGRPAPDDRNFCANSVAAGTADKNPEDYKRVTVTVSWTEQGNYTRKVDQSGLINNPGSASGPAVRSLTPVGYTAPFVVTTDVNAVTWDVTTSSKPATIGWLLDGTPPDRRRRRRRPDQAAPGSSTGNMKTLDDGAYVVAAEAFNVYGVSGPGRQETIVLNRFVPRAPKQVDRRPHRVRHRRDRVDGELRARHHRLPGLPRRGRDAGLRDRHPEARHLLHRHEPAVRRDARVLRPRLRQGHERQPPRERRLGPPARDEGQHGAVQGHRPHAPDARERGHEADLDAAPCRRTPTPATASRSIRVYRDGTALGDRYERYFDGSGTPSVTWTGHRHRRHHPQLLGHRGRPALPRVARRRAGDGMTARTRDEAGFTVIELAGRRRDLARRPRGDDVAADLDDDPAHGDRRSRGRRPAGAPGDRPARRASCATSRAPPT